MQMIVCSMCGQAFDASHHQACQKCPLQTGCKLARCPNCGYEMVNVHTSRLARWAARWLTRGSGESPSLKNTLADLIPGQSAQVVGFSAGLSLKQQAHLLAYGVAPGRQVQVLQHNPVTVVQVEHLELALETALAQDVYISALAGA
jgi:Fe2+ transport system protein FeoA